MYALVDGNNFYVSCERVFRPDLRNRPVVVLSNNDGCFISRSDEVKQYDIPMGAPYFQWKKQMEEIGAVVCSANFSLYGDLSQRMMELCTQMAHTVEVDSIDEVFVQFPDGMTHAQQLAAAEDLARSIKKQIGISVSIGIGPSKTLAKLANHVVKQNKKVFSSRVLHTELMRDQTAFLEMIPVGKVWGVGRQYSRLLHQEGVQTARQLRDLPDAWVLQQMTIVGLRMVWELRGQSCIKLEEVRPMKKAILSSRSFGRPVTTQSELAEAIATYVARASEKLRQERAVAGLVTVSIRSSPFSAQRFFRASRTASLPEPTQHTPTITQVATQLLKQIYRDGVAYKKAAVMLTGIAPTAGGQPSLYVSASQRQKQEQLMQTVDQLNRRFGRRRLRYAAEGRTRQLWSGKRELQSPCYTTRWEDLCRVRA